MYNLFVYPQTVDKIMEIKTIKENCIYVIVSELSVSQLQHIITIVCLH